MAPYQAIEKGSASDSVGKLNALMLPALEGKSFLDLGCNTGFFCGAALAAGAHYVVGVDNHEPNISTARRLFPDAHFVVSDWDTYFGTATDKFDVILFASALHYAVDQEKVLEAALDRLTESGVLILECGLGIAQQTGQQFIAYDRWDGQRRYFTRSYIADFFQARGFQIFVQHPSVKQAGDEIPRFVLHVRKPVPCMIWNEDPPDSGKSQLGRVLEASAEHRTVDSVANAIIEASSDQSLKQFLSFGIDRFWSAIVERGQQDWAAQKIVDFIGRPPTPPRTAIYAEGSLPAPILNAVRTRLLDGRVMLFTVTLAGGKTSGKETQSITCVHKEDGIWFSTPSHFGAVDRFELLEEGGSFLRIQVSTAKATLFEAASIKIGDHTLPASIVQQLGRTTWLICPLVAGMSEEFENPGAVSIVMTGRNRQYTEVRCDRAIQLFRRRYEGCLDEISNGVLRGWAHDFLCPQVPLELSLYLDDQELGRTVANLFRRDLFRAGLGSGQCGFCFHIPAGLSGSEKIMIKRTDGIRCEISGNGRSIGDLVKEVVGEV